jgi:hypothetical protein
MVVLTCFLGLTLFGDQILFNVMQLRSDRSVAFEHYLQAFQGQILFCEVIGVVLIAMLMFHMRDLVLIAFLLAALAGCLRANETDFGIDVHIVVGALGLAKLASIFLTRYRDKWSSGRYSAREKSRCEGVECFANAIVIVLTVGSLPHLDFWSRPYLGPRWTGLWQNPNSYGMLMGANLVLSMGVWVAVLKEGKSSMLRRYGFLIAMGFALLGLLCSFSRGAWSATSVGMLYLAWSYGKLRWRHVLPVIAVAAVAVFFFWNATADNAPWYIKRLDFGRPSAQHRLSAWRAGLEIMRDHPFGVGWSKTVEVYQSGYSSPENGAAAIATNDYLMLGTELGILGLACFVAYCALCLRGKCRIEQEDGRIQAAFRSGAIVLLVAFWFDGGLFRLSTAALFWVLLELGAERSPRTTITVNNDAKAHPA